MEFERDIVKARFRGHVVLASASERRRRLMEEAGYDFEVVPSGVEEENPGAADPLALAQLLAHEKARDVARKLARGVIVGADTVVALGGEILGKPRDPEDARRILGRLSGSTHEVITGLCVMWRTGIPACHASTGQTGMSDPPWKHLLGVEVTRIAMRRLTREELDDYVARGEGLGKAGAYAIQETGDRFIERMDGSFTNVVGLPMPLLADLLDRAQRLAEKT